MMGSVSLLRYVVTVALTGSVLSGAAAGAQQSSSQAPRSTGRRVTVRVDTNETMRVTIVLDGLDSLLRSLSQSRALEDRIGMALRDYSVSAADASHRQALEEQLQKLAEKNVQLMSRIQMACNSRKGPDRAPEGYLGVTFNIMGTVRREANGPEVYRFDDPPEVISVEPGSPAEKAGVHRGDHIVMLDGKDVVGRDVILAQLLVPGRKLPVRLSRDGKEQTLAVLIQKRPDGFGDQCTDIDLAMAPLMTQVMPGQPMRAFTYVRPSPPARATAPNAPSLPEPPSVGYAFTIEPPPPVAVAGYASLVAGAQITTLTEDFKELTGADVGVMVQRVAAETPAAAAGLRGGDVIVEANDRVVTSARVLQRMIGEADDHALKLKVVRKGKARTVWLKW
jgi:serine protease Do